MCRDISIPVRSFIFICLFMKHYCSKRQFPRSTATQRFHSSSRIGSSQQKAGLFPTHFNMRGGRQEILRLPQTACHHVILHDNRAPYIIQLRLSKQIHHNKAILKCECRKRLLRNQAFTKKIQSFQAKCSVGKTQLWYTLIHWYGPTKLSVETSSQQ